MRKIISSCLGVKINLDKKKITTHILKSIIKSNKFEREFNQKFKNNFVNNVKKIHKYYLNYFKMN